MARRSRRKFSDEPKADAVRMVREIGNFAKAARDLDLTETTLRNWMKRADIDEGKGPDGALNSDERKELQRLKRENHALQQERAFLKNLSGASGAPPGGLKLPLIPFRLLMGRGRLLIGALSPLKNMIRGCLRTCHW